MDSLKPTYQVILNTLAAQAGDVVVNDKNLVVGPSSNASPKINLSHDCKLTRQYPVNETAAVYTYTPGSLAVNTTYGFTLLQNVDGVMRKVVVEVASGLTAFGSTTVVCDLLRSALTKYINTGKIKVTSNANGTATVVVTGATGYPLFDMTAVQTGTGVQTLPAAVTASGAGTIATTGVVTAAAHGFSSGDLVSITGATLGVFVRNGVTTNGSISNVPIYVSGTGTFVLLGVTVTTAATAASIVKQPANSAGQYADVIAQTADQGTTVAPVSGRKYAKYTFEYANQVSSLNSMSRFQEGTHILFVDTYHDALASGTAFQLFDIGLSNVINGATVNLGAVSTTANIELLANPSVS
jgi:hypothetical protein